jgi:hypothetical protein
VEEILNLFANMHDTGKEPKNGKKHHNTNFEKDKNKP